MWPGVCGDRRRPDIGGGSDTLPNDARPIDVHESEAGVSHRPAITVVTRSWVSSEMADRRVQTFSFARLDGSSRQYPPVSESRDDCRDVFEVAVVVQDGRLVLHGVCRDQGVHRACGAQQPAVPEPFLDV